MANTYRKECRLEADMKKTIGICFFMAVVLVGAVGMLSLQRSAGEDGQGEASRGEAVGEIQETEQEVAESMARQEPFCYVIREQDGLLVVYEQDGETILLETHIEVKALDSDTQEALREGIRVLDEQELYDLLESYSS